MNRKILHALLKKAKDLWKDKRPYWKRLICAGAAMLAACFTFLFFGPLEMVAFASGSLEYGYKDVLLPLALLAGGVFLLGSGLLALLRGKIYNYVVTVIFGATVCGYLQAALMNGNFGLLNGEIIDWTYYKSELVINALIWIAIFIVILFVMYMHKKFWRNMVTIVSIILVVMQFAPTVGILAGTYKDVKDTEEYFLSMGGINEYSAEDNIFVFVLDYMDYQYIEQVLAKDPTFFDELDGFTGYRDAIPNFCRTQPALNTILTGSIDLPYREEKDAFFSDSWTDGERDILKALKDQEYTVDLYANFVRLFSDADDAKGYVENLTTDKGEIQYATLLKNLINFSAYRYTPIALKPFFWADTNYYNAGVFQNASISNTVYVEEQNYYTGLFQKATDERDGGSFKFYHFRGSHPPYYMNKEGEVPGGTTSVVEATMGGFNILYKTFDRMKELGIYEDATIIITADHGNARSLTGEKLTPMQIGMFYKPAGSADTPLAWSDAQVSTANIPATIVKAAGADYSAYGTPLDEVKEGETVERVFYRNIMDSTDWNDDKIQVYEIRGSGDVYENWVKVDEFDIPDENKLYG